MPKRSIALSTRKTYVITLDATGAVRAEVSAGKETHRFEVDSVINGARSISALLVELKGCDGRGKSSCLKVAAPLHVIRLQTKGCHDYCSYRWDRRRFSRDRDCEVTSLGLEYRLIAISITWSKFRAKRASANDCCRRANEAHYSRGMSVFSRRNSAGHELAGRRETLFHRSANVSDLRFHERLRQPNPQ